MPPLSSDPGAVFRALADPTRRQIVDWLGDEGTCTASTLSDRLPMSRQGVTKHLVSLREAGVVTSHRVGRETVYSLDTDAFQAANEWLVVRTAAWEATLERLRRFVEDG